MSSNMIYSPRPPTRKKLKCKKQEEQNSKRMKRRAPSPPRKLETVQKKQFEERKSLKQTSQVWCNFGVRSAVAQLMLRIQNLWYMGEKWLIEHLTQLELKTFKLKLKYFRELMNQNGKEKGEVLKEVQLQEADQDQPQLIKIKQVWANIQESVIYYKLIP